ncbi:MULTISPECIES: phage holin [Providencia]|uniref:phage holin n=1 Tax=Providencia TaxID=586 RepID=UPI0003E2977F|nr:MULTISPECIES: phage holin [Providencia]MTC21312.1 hypothetical protein [Providencia sp. wls1938]ETS98962.1 hypothetical protein HMPREF1568_3130 [Providencia alcalifaciens PAL-3]ETT05594.1 hypothetical protein HMPREF1562_1965 [Providencia alcalifaciens F90-2004]EUC99365.1 hypothetical protein HMPREF1566_0541 [Providencia alcalifaciens PAL-1]MTC22153.1 hypothetical protein [Providencia sp. wls1938]
MSPIAILEKDGGMDEKIAQLSTPLSYWLAGLGLFFSGLSLYEWVALVGVVASILLGVATFVVNAYHQAKRTRLMEMYLSHTDKPDETVNKMVSVSSKLPKDL